MKNLADLTCCRAIFAAWVFAYHVNLQAQYADGLDGFGAFVHHGILGVDAFFILSGMILAYAHHDFTLRLSDACRFWGRRLARIYPVHVAMIVAIGLMVGGASLLHVHPRDPDRFSIGELLSHLALVHAWGLSDRWAWNYPSWSISAEWAGYLLFPFLWPALRKQNGIGLALVLPFTLLGAASARMLAHAENLSLTYDGGLLRFFPEFIAGMAILPLLQRLPARIRGRPVAAVGAIAAIAAAIAGAETASVVALWVMLAGFLRAGLQGGGAVLGRIPTLYWLGEISYSFYMSFAIIETIQASIWRWLALQPEKHPFYYVFTTTVMTLGLATLSWKLIERPCMRAYSAFVARRTHARMGYPA